MRAPYFQTTNPFSRNGLKRVIGILFLEVTFYIFVIGDWVVSHVSTNTVNRDFSEKVQVHSLFFDAPIDSFVTRNAVRLFSCCFLTAPCPKKQHTSQLPIHFPRRTIGVGGFPPFQNGGDIFLQPKQSFPQSFPICRKVPLSLVPGNQSPQRSA